MTFEALVAFIAFVFVCHATEAVTNKKKEQCKDASITPCIIS